jgi:hypothetical protein
VRERCQFFESQEEPLKTLDRFHFKTGTRFDLIFVRDELTVSNRACCFHYYHQITVTTAPTTN